VSGGPGLLLGFAELPGVRGVLLVDLAGRVVDRVGFEVRRDRTQTATLVAGLHAAGARLSEAAGRPGRSRIRVRTEAGELMVVRVPPPAVHLLLLHLDATVPALDEPLEALLLKLAREVPGGPLVADAAAFEGTLETDR
jgi:predicted regulator of Ras-like GTPase activity (Roadblock/LC7/MglB family)